MKKVIVYRKQLLRITETFIKAQVKGYKNYSAILYGENYWSDSLPLDDINHKVLLNNNAGGLAKLFAKIRQRFGIVPGQLLREFKNEQAQLFHAHTGFDGVIAWPYAKKLGVPLVVTLHGQCTTTKKKDFFLGRLGFWNRFYPLQLLRLGRNRNVHFIAVSDATRQTAIEFGLPSERTKVLYSGIRLDEFPKSTVAMADRPKRIVFVARLIEFKGCRYLIEAFKRVFESTPDAELIIIGEGPLRKELELQASSHNQSIQFLGACGRKQVVEALSLARVFCLPSITIESGNYETFGVVAVEAQAVGVPVVTSARGAKESVIDGQTGYYFPERDVDTLAMLLTKLLNDPALAAVMGDKAAQHARDTFGTETCNAAIEAHYDSILSS
jgi:glycosyltransferase involved in cell wall biosynthesis